MPLVPRFPSGFRPRIGVRGMLPIAGMTNSVAGTIHFPTNRPSPCEGRIGETKMVGPADRIARAALIGAASRS